MILLFTTVTSPIRKIYHLKSALKKVIENKYDSSWSISSIDKKFHPKKVLKISDKISCQFTLIVEKKFLQGNNLKIFILEMVYFIYSKYQNLLTIEIFI